MSKAEVKVVASADVAKIDLPAGSWSRMLVQSDTVAGNQSSLGYSRFEPGTVLVPVRHAVEELAYVVKGEGELRMDDGTVKFKEGEALFIPAGVWHAVANTGDQPLEMVFSFPHPDYPSTEKRTG